MSEHYTQEQMDCNVGVSWAIRVHLEGNPLPLTICTVHDSSCLCGVIDALTRPLVRGPAIIEIVRVPKGT